MFEEAEVVIKARGVGYFADFATAEQYVVITNKPRVCQELEEDIQRINGQAEPLGQRLAELRAELAGIEIPAELDINQSRELVESKEKQLTEAAEAFEKSVEMVDTLRNLNNSYLRLLALLANDKVTTRSSRYYEMAGRYKNSKQTLQDKIEFYEGLEGKKAPDNIDLEQLILDLRERRKEVGKIGYLLTQLGSLVTLAVPSPGGKWSILPDLALFVLGTVVDRTISDQQFIQELNFHGRALEKLKEHLAGVRAAADELDKAVKENADSSTIEELANRLTRKLLEAIHLTLDCRTASTAALAKAKQLQRSASKHRKEVETEYRARKKLFDVEQERANQRKIEIKRLKERIQILNAEIADVREKLKPWIAARSERESLYREHCTEDPLSKSTPAEPNKPCPDFLAPDHVLKQGSWAAFTPVGPMTLHGGSYKLLVLQHPGNDGPTEVTYNLGLQAKRFTATIGIDQSMNPNDDLMDQPDVEYLIYIDGGLVWRSGVITHKTPSKSIDIDLTGAKKLKLVVTNGGDDCYHDWAVWADPKIHSSCQ